jgi:hypothetical protein
MAQLFILVIMTAEICVFTFSIVFLCRNACLRLYSDKKKIP